MAREATGAQEDAWSKPRRRLEQPLRPDLSLTIADLQNMAVAEWLQSFKSVSGPMERLGII